MENTEQKLTDYLKEKYSPTAIILHGSRANNRAKEHSDWDFIIFTKQDVNPLTREIIFGANIELRQIILPIPSNKFLGYFFRAENTKVLYDPESITKNLLEQNNSYIKLGNQFDSNDRIKRHAFLVSALDGMKDYSDNHLIIFDKKTDFYTRVVESWFRFFKNEFEPSHYLAFPIIQEEDPEFYMLIEEFVDNTSADNLITTGNKIITRLFPDIS